MPGQVESEQESETNSTTTSGRITQQRQFVANTGNSPTTSNRTKNTMAEPKSVFGWTTIDGIKFPYLLREDKKFVAVRMVEMKLLSKYPSTYPDELKNRPPLMSHYITEVEIKLLNEINAEHCAGEYGSYQFSAQDLIVKLQDFEEFYGIVKKHFPDEVLRNLPQKNKIDGGWVQVNNTVVPFVFRNEFRFVPLSVIRYAAQLLVDVQVEGHIPTDDECKFFNDICKSAGLNFKFGKSTKLVMLNMVQSVSTTPVIITELPKDDPFGAAEFKGDEQETTRLPTQVAPDSVPGAPGNAPAGISAVGPALTGLPSGMIPPNSMMPTFPPTGSPYWMNPHMGIFPGFGPGPGAGPVPNPFGMQQTPKGPVSPHGEVNNNSAVSKDFPERPNSHGSNPRSTPSSTARRSSTGTPSPTGQNMYGNQLRVAPPSAAAGAPPSSMGMPPPGLLHSQTLMAGNRMMFPMLPNQSPSEYQKLLQMVQMQHQSLKSQVGPKGPPPLVPVDHLTTGGRMHTAPPNVTVSRNSSIPKQGSRPRGRPPIISADEPKVRPQHSSRPISTAMANEPQINARVPIKRLDFEGKSMACLVKEGSCFALMEALSRVFFPYVPMDEFRYAVEMVLSVPVLTLTDEEEHAFIRFYGLPTAKLKCKKAIKLVDFSQYLPQLKYMYRERAEAAGSVGASFSPNKSSSALQNAILPPRFGGGNIGIRTKSLTSKGVQGTISNSHAQLQLTSSALKSMMDNKNKRGADAPPPHVAPPNKKAKKRLDDMVNRLWSKNQSSSTATATTPAETSNDTLESGSPRGNPELSTGWRAVGNQKQSAVKSSEQEENEGRVLEDSSSRDEESMATDYDGSSMDMQDASVSQEYNSVPEENAPAAKDSLTVSEEVSPSEDSINMDASVEKDASAAVSINEISSENGAETANTSSSQNEEGKIATDETTCADNEISKNMEENDASKETTDTNEATMEHSATDGENHMSESTIEQPAAEDGNHLHELTTNHVPAPPVGHCAADNIDQMTKAKGEDHVLKPTMEQSATEGEGHVLKPTMEKITNEDENRVPEPQEKHFVLETTMEHSGSEDGNHLPEPTTKHTTNEAASHVTEPRVNHSVTENDNHVPESAVEHSACEGENHVPEPTKEHSATGELDYIPESRVEHSATEEKNDVPEPKMEHSTAEEDNEVLEPIVEHSVNEDENDVPDPKMEECTLEHSAAEDENHVLDPVVEHSVTEDENHVLEPVVEHSVTDDENHAPERKMEHSAGEGENHVPEPTKEHSADEAKNHVPEPTEEHSAAEDENHVPERTMEDSVTEDNNVPEPTVEHSVTEDRNHLPEPAKEYSVAEDENHVPCSTMEHTEAEDGNHTQKESPKNLELSIEKCLEKKSDADFESKDTIDANESKESIDTKKKINDKEDVNESGEIPPVEEVAVKNEEGPGRDVKPSGTSKEDMSEGTKTDTTQLQRDQARKEETMETEIIVSATEGIGQVLEENSDEAGEAPHEMEKDMPQLKEDQTGSTKEETCSETELIANAGNGIERMLEENWEKLPTETSDNNLVSEQNTAPADDAEVVNCQVMEDDNDVMTENKGAQEIIPDSEPIDRGACEEKSASETPENSAVATGTVQQNEVTEENEITRESEECKSDHIGESADGHVITDGICNNTVEQAASSLPGTLKENSDAVETPDPATESVNTGEKEGIKMGEPNTTEALDVSDTPNAVTEEEDMEVDKNISSLSPVSDDNAAVSPATGNSSSIQKENMTETEEILHEDKNVTGEINQFSDEQTKDDNQEGPRGATSDSEENIGKAPGPENNTMGDEICDVDAHVSVPSAENTVVAEDNNQNKDDSCLDDFATNAGKEIAMEEGTDDKEEEISSAQKDDHDAVNAHEDTKTVAVEGKVTVTEIASNVKPSEESQDIGDSSEIASD